MIELNENEFYVCTSDNKYVWKNLRFIVDHDFHRVSKLKNYIASVLKRERKSETPITVSDEMLLEFLSKYQITIKKTER